MITEMVIICFLRSSMLGSCESDRSVTQGMQTRKKACRIASENGAPFRIIQLRAQQDPLFGAYGQVSSQVREISSMQNLIDSCHVAQHVEHRIACSKGGVPINPAEYVSSGAPLVAARDEPHFVDDRETRGKVGD